MSWIDLYDNGFWKLLTQANCTFHWASTIKEQKIIRAPDYICLCNLKIWTWDNCSSTSSFANFIILVFIYYEADFTNLFIYKRLQDWLGITFFEYHLILQFNWMKTKRKYASLETSLALNRLFLGKQNNIFFFRRNLQNFHIKMGRCRFLHLNCKSKFKFSNEIFISKARSVVLHW